MKRYKIYPKTDLHYYLTEPIENKTIDAFLEEIWTVCEKHNLAISHEDKHGAFEIVRMESSFKTWLFQALDCT
jgi:hypothetical protein